MKKNWAYLILEDGSYYRGTLLGSFPSGMASVMMGEVVFNTSMSGYQEIITDPSYKGQIVIFTYPSIGNYGVNVADNESDHPYLSGIIMRDYCEYPSNFQSQKTLDEFLQDYSIPGLSGIDTRAVVRKIRDLGSMMGGLFPEKYAVDKKPREFEKWLAAKVNLLKNAPSMEGANLTSGFDGSHNRVFLDEYSKQKESYYAKVGVLDFGIKKSILRYLMDEGLFPVVFPGDVPMEKWFNYNPEEIDGFFFSNGPGDPAAVTDGIDNIKKILDTKKPVFGICLGHQMLTHALGSKTYKMKFGHHGGNQPVKLQESGNVIITAQNHGFAADTGGLPNPDISRDFNPNDQTSEGFLDSQNNILSVQYHPEASPGPHDALGIFGQFRKMVEKYKENR